VRRFRAHSGSLTYEPKLDGWRCLTFHRLSGRVALQSRQQKTLTPYFPEIVAAIVEQIPAGTVLDGELVVYRDGRCDFAALQRRVSGRSLPMTTRTWNVPPRWRMPVRSAAARFLGAHDP